MRSATLVLTLCIGSEYYIFEVSVMHCRTICTDRNGQAKLHSALDETCTPIALTGGPIVAVLWDASDRNVFLLSDRASLHVFVVEPTIITGPGNDSMHPTE